MAFIEVFLVAFLVSYLGSIPPGTINISVMQLSIQSHRRAALFFGLGASLVELVYAGATVKFQQYLFEHENLTYGFQVVTAIVLIVLGLANLFSRSNSKSFMSHGSIRRRTGFKRGVVLGLLNPLTIPFWLAVTGYLVSHNWITVSGYNFWAYVIGLALGTFILMVTVDLLGSKFQRVADNSFLVHKVPGILFIMMGLYNIYEFMI